VYALWRAFKRIQVCFFISSLDLDMTSRQSFRRRFEKEKNNVDDGAVFLIHGTHSAS
jgi:hypothetical protein